jgi:tetratricopeptide (TPR) repeat protein
MKRSERHHLKENELAATVARLRAAADRRRKPITVALAAAVVAALALGGYTLWRARANSLAAEGLAEALLVLEAPVVPPAPAPPADGETPVPSRLPPPPGSYPSEEAKLDEAIPKLMAVADAYPRTPAGIAARYHAAASLARLGRTDEAEQRYREVIERETQLYGSMARLGLAEVLARAGNYDAAIETWQEITERPHADLPVDGALMQLGRTYARAGRPADAVEAFNRIVQEFPDSVYAQPAREEMNVLKAGQR